MLDWNNTMLPLLTDVRRAIDADSASFVLGRRAAYGSDVLVLARRRRETATEQLVGSQLELLVETGFLNAEWPDQSVLSREVKLTEKGLQAVYGWPSGDERRFREALLADVEARDCGSP